MEKAIHQIGKLTRSILLVFLLLGSLCADTFQYLVGEQKVALEQRSSSEDESSNDNDTLESLDGFALQAIASTTPQLSQQNFLPTPSVSLNFVQKKDEPKNWYFFPSLLPYYQTIFTFFLAPNAP